MSNDSFEFMSKQLPSADGLEVGLVNSDEWHSTAELGTASSEVLLRKEFVSEIEATDDRKIKFVISTGDPDREKDIISPEGWSTSNYLQNPVVLFAHDYASLPVARATSVKLENGNLIAEAEFADEKLNPMAEQVYQMLKQGYLRGASVGFRPLDFTYNEQRGGVDFAKQELLEFSVVPVPANPGALMSAGMSADNAKALKVWATKTLESLEPELKAPVSDQLDDFLDTIRKSMNNIKVAVRETIKNVDEFQNTFQYTSAKSIKGLTPSNPSDFGTAPLEQKWETPTLSDFTNGTWTDLSDAERKNIAKHFAWAAKATPTSYGEMKLPHHVASGDVVWRGVASASAYLDQTKLPSADIGAVKSHLANHYKQFDRVAPWERDGAAWSAYCKARTKLIVKIGTLPTEKQLAVLLDDHGFEDEAITLISQSSKSAASDGAVTAPSLPVEVSALATDSILEKLDDLDEKVQALGQTANAAPPDDFVLEIDEGDEDYSAEGLVDIDVDELRREMVAALKKQLGSVVSEEVHSAINTMRGRID
jgi:HK97 family phage prohead protease